jgi:esterase FrsA
MSKPLPPDLKYLGPRLEEGPLPAVFYFALSAEDSLHLDPFNQPVNIWKEAPLRVFSLDLPSHGPGEDKLVAMESWAAGLSQQPQDFFEPFFSKFADALDSLGDAILPGALAVAGLSRGGFISAHLAARFSQISAVLGFAPATKLTELGGFPAAASRYDLIGLVPALASVKLKFYIGNHDIRVGTSGAFEFCEALAKEKFSKGERSPQVEFSMYPSIGHKGHGTPPHIFREGALWLLSSIPGR